MYGLNATPLVIASRHPLDTEGTQQSLTQVLACASGPLRGSHGNRAEQYFLYKGTIDFDQAQGPIPLRIPAVGSNLEISRAKGRTKAVVRAACSYD